MANWMDLVADCTDGPLIEYEIHATQARDWRFPWPAAVALTDSAGLPYDFSAIPGAQMTITIWEGSTPIIPDANWTWVGNADGTFVITCGNGATAGKAGTVAAFPNGKNYTISAELTTPTGEHVQFIGGTVEVNHGFGGDL